MYEREETHLAPMMLFHDRSDEEGTVRVESVDLSKIGRIENCKSFYIYESDVIPFETSLASLDAFRKTPIGSP